MPHKYELNNRQIDAHVPSQQGGNISARWIKVIESGEVIMWAREDPDKLEYIVSLFLTVDYSPNDIDTMPYWCEELLQLKEAAYFALAAVVSPPAPGSSWTDWSHAWGREAYLNRALKKLNLEYPHDSDD